MANNYLYSMVPREKTVKRKRPYNPESFKQLFNGSKGIENSEMVLDELEDWAKDGGVVGSDIVLILINEIRCLQDQIETCYG